MGHSKDSFHVCMFTEFSSLEFFLTHLCCSVKWTRESQFELSILLFVWESLCVQVMPLAVHCVHRGGSLFSSCPVCLSPCVHTSFILLFLTLLNPALPLAGSPGCASLFLDGGVLSFPFLTVSLHSPWPISLIPNPCYVLPICVPWGFLLLWGKGCLMHWLWQGHLLNCGIQRVQYKQHFSHLSDSPVKAIDFNLPKSKIFFD